MATSLVNTRCYLAPVIATVIGLKDHMSRRHWEILRGTPFAHLMEVEPLTQKRGVLDALMQMYDARI